MMACSEGDYSHGLQQFVADKNANLSRALTVLIAAWNAFQCNIDEALIIRTATLMKSLGLQVLLYGAS
jgi:hypothetical protein